MVLPAPVRLVVSSLLLPPFGPRGTCSFSRAFFSRLLGSSPLPVYTRGSLARGVVQEGGRSLLFTSSRADMQFIFQNSRIVSSWRGGFFDSAALAGRPKAGPYLGRSLSACRHGVGTASRPSGRLRLQAFLFVFVGGCDISLYGEEHDFRFSSQTAESEVSFVKR